MLGQLRRRVCLQCNSWLILLIVTNAFAASIRFRRRLGHSSGASLRHGMPELATAAEVARDIADALESERVPYAIGGAIALGFYAPPRATIDVDVNVFVAIPDRLSELLGILERGGFHPDDDDRTLSRHALEDGQFRGRMQGLRVDVFVPSVPYYWELESRRREVELLGRPMWVLGPEDLAILKMMFFRRKDLADIEALLRDQRKSFDMGYVRNRLTELVGEDDERVRALDEIERDVAIE